MLLPSFGSFLACWFVVTAVHAYGPLPTVAPPPMVPSMKNTSPWIPIRRPKYYYAPPPPPTYRMPVPPPPPAYGMPVPRAPSPTPYQAPANLPVTAQTIPADNQWMPIVSEQAPGAPVLQEMAVIFEMPTENPPAPDWMGQSAGQSAGQPAGQIALPATGKLPLVPLIFRNPSAASPTTAPSSIWSAPESPNSPQADVPASALAPGPSATPDVSSLSSDQAPSSIWSVPESQSSPQADVPASASAATPAPSGIPDVLSPIGPPGTFLPLSSDIISPFPADPSLSQAPSSPDSWPETPKDVPAAAFLPTLPPATFGQFDVPPARK